MAENGKRKKLQEAKKKSAQFNFRVTGSKYHIYLIAAGEITSLNIFVHFNMGHIYHPIGEVVQLVESGRQVGSGDNEDID